MNKFAYSIAAYWLIFTIVMIGSYNAVMSLKEATEKAGADLARAQIAQVEP